MLLSESLNFSCFGSFRKKLYHSKSPTFVVFRNVIRYRIPDFFFVKILGGCFKYFVFSTLFREDFRFDYYFSDGLVQPPTRINALLSRASILEGDFGWNSPEFVPSLRSFCLFHGSLRGPPWNHPIGCKWLATMVRIR